MLNIILMIESVVIARNVNYLKLYYVEMDIYETHVSHNLLGDIDTKRLKFLLWLGLYHCKPALSTAQKMMIVEDLTLTRSMLMKREFAVLLKREVKVQILFTEFLIQDNIAMKATAGSMAGSWTGPHKAINGDLNDRFPFHSAHGAKFAWMAVDLRKICKVLLFIFN